MWNFLLAAAVLGSVDPTDIIIEYKECIESVAFGLIRSDESAESLVGSGEYECRPKLVIVENALRSEIQSNLHSNAQLRAAQSGMSKSDVEHLVAEILSEQMEEMKTEIHASALRNVVFVKARINEKEKYAPNP